MKRSFVRGLANSSAVWVTGYVFAAAFMTVASVHAQTFIKVDPRGTYLFVDTSEDGKDIPIPPTTIDLSALDFSSKIPITDQYIGFTELGGFSARVVDLGSYPDDQRSMGAVFQGPPGNPLSPGEGGSYSQFVSLPTYPDNIPTDIPQDFSVPPRIAGSPTDQVAIVRVPAGATKVAFTPNDSHFEDNGDPNADYKAKLVTFQGVMHSSSVTIDKGISGPGSMGAFVTLSSRIGLSDAAKLGGYDHFNWLQEITGFSYKGSLEKSIVPFGLGFLGRSTGIDPLIGGNLGLPANSYNPYWNEIHCLLCSSKYFYEFWRCASRESIDVP